MDIGWPEILIIALVIFALFGYKKLPDATRAVGRSLRIFKAETKGLGDSEPPALQSSSEVTRPVEEQSATGAQGGSESR